MALVMLTAGPRWLCASTWPKRRLSVTDPKSVSLWLTKDELIVRTNKRRMKDIVTELARQRVEFTVRWDGFPLVNRAQFEGAQVKPTRRKEPKWSAI